MKYRVQENTQKIPAETRFSTPFQTGHGAHPASCTGFLSQGQSGRGVASSVKVKENVQLLVYSSSVPSCLAAVVIYSYFTLILYFAIMLEPPAGP
jgi:hypothetical protein